MKKKSTRDDSHKFFGQTTVSADVNPSDPLKLAQHDQKYDYTVGDDGVGLTLEKLKALVQKPPSSSNKPGSVI